MGPEHTAYEEITFPLIPCSITRPDSQNPAVMTTRVRDVTSYCPEGAEGLKTDCLETYVKVKHETLVGK
jgi:hypothetical protein